MGRYYETNTGRRGKFMLGVQDSTDPEYMGMNEQERGYIEYLADREDDKKEMEKYKGKTRWYCERKGYVSFEIANNALALARIRLATTILSDIREDGECYLQAEL